VLRIEGENIKAREVMRAVKIRQQLVDQEKEKRILTGWQKRSGLFINTSS